MTTDQEADDIAASVRHRLVQRGKDAENWRRQANDWEARCGELREQVDNLTNLLAVVRAERDEYGAGLMRAAGDYVALERQTAELTQLVGTETPIAAFTLAQSWFAEKAGYMERIQELTLALDEQAHDISSLRATISDLRTQRLRLERKNADYAMAIAQWEQEPNTDALVSAIDQAISNLRGMKALNDDPHIEEMIDATADLLGARVSPDNAKPTITPLEETQPHIPRPWLGICGRCGTSLNNLSPGISVVAGGVSVCATCLRPGEEEIARAR